MSAGAPAVAARNHHAWTPRSERELASIIDSMSDK
jgi:hypothetical protein